MWALVVVTPMVLGGVVPIRRMGLAGRTSLVVVLVVVSGVVISMSPSAILLVAERNS